MAFQAFGLAVLPLFPDLTQLMLKILPRLRRVLTDGSTDTWLFNLLTLIRWECEQGADDQQGGIRFDLISVSIWHLRNKSIGLTKSKPWKAVALLRDRG